MASKKNGFNWNDLAERGKIEGILKKRLKKLKRTIISELKLKLLDNITVSKNLITEFKESIENKLDEVYSEYGLYTKKKVEIKKKEFHRNIEEMFDLLYHKKAFCSIGFDGYSIYMFFKALSTILPEIEIQIQKDQLYILTMDPLRIAILEINLSHKNYEFYQPGKISFNLNDLQNVLKCKNSDDSKVNLVFGAER